VGFFVSLHRSLNSLSSVLFSFPFQSILHSLQVHSDPLQVSSIPLQIFAWSLQGFLNSCCRVSLSSLTGPPSCTCGTDSACQGRQGNFLRFQVRLQSPFCESCERKLHLISTLARGTPPPSPKPSWQFLFHF
jgi:hypothetical protein